MVGVYLSGPIIHQNLRKDDFYKTIIQILESKGHEVFAPQFLPPADSTVIYKRDVDAVERCDVLIGEVSSPSLGVGMEIMLAITLQKPVLLFHNPEFGLLSKMVKGALGLAIFSYKQLQDVRKVLERIDLLNLQLGPSCPSCKASIVELNEEKLRCIVCGREE